MNWSISFAPLVPDTFLWIAGGIAVSLLAFMTWRRTRGVWARMFAVAALLAALTNPTLKEEVRETLSNIAIVVVDKSTSQSLAQRPQQTIEIRKALDARLSKIKDLEVKWVDAHGGSIVGRSGTQLFSSLNAALENTPPDRIAGVIFLSDGQVHDVPPTASALGFNAPVHTLLTGRRGEFDRRVEVIKAPRFGIVGQDREIEFKVRETGKKRQTSDVVSVIVRREGLPDETIRTAIGRSVKVEMPFPHAGTNVLEVELEKTDGELTQANNRVVVSAEGVRENLRVLLVSGAPHAGERTWRNLLKSDAAVDLVHFTILRPPEKQDGTPIRELSLIAFPTRELFLQKIKDFDLIIFDRYQYRGLLRRNYYSNIAHYVASHGGAVLVAAGDDYAGRTSLYRTPLAPILPARPTGQMLDQPFRASITDVGAKHPVTRALPGAGKDGSKPTWGRWLRQVEVKPDRGRVVMNGVGEQPLLILDKRGKGRVALLTSDHAWLWARGYDGGGPHTDLLRRLSHWLMKEPDLEEERLLAEAKGMQIAIERLSMQENVGDVTLKHPDGTTQIVPLEAAKAGVWRALIEVDRPGLYKAQTTTDTRTLTAVAHAGNQDKREMSEVTATADKLRPLLAATGGAAFWTDTRTASDSAAADSIMAKLPRISMLSNARVLSGSGWMGLKDRDAYLTRGIKLTPLFTGLLALAALLFLLSLAWWREGR